MNSKRLIMRIVDQLDRICDRKLNRYRVKDCTGNGTLVHNEIPYRSTIKHDKNILGSKTTLLDPPDRKNRALVTENGIQRES
jgi:hypothetical protein